MRGLELARAYWEACGAPMLREQFPDLLPCVAAGLFGSGSECFGYDDDISRDHDFEPGFMLLLPGEDVVDRRAAFLLERAYAKLPATFMGVARQRMNPVGGARHGVMRVADFFLEKVGAADGGLTLQQWLTVPEHALAEAVNGAVFYDGSGEVTAIRRRLSAYPADVRKKRLAGHLLLMGQAGQYNYPRCLRHGETGAAQLAAGEFVRHAMRALERLPLLAEVMEYLLTTDNDGEMAASKGEVIEGMAADVIGELRRQGLSTADCGDLEKHALSVNDSIGDAAVRNLHVLAAAD